METNAAYVANIIYRLMLQILFIDLAELIVILDLSKIELGLTDARKIKK